MRKLGIIILFLRYSFCVYSQISEFEKFENPEKETILQNLSTAPVTVFYGLNESHGNDWIQCASNGVIGISYYNKHTRELIYKTILPDGSENEEVVTTGDHLEISVLLFKSDSKPNIFVAVSNHENQIIYHYSKNSNDQWVGEIVQQFNNTWGSHIYELSADVGPGDSFHLLALIIQSNPDSNNFYYAFLNSNLVYLNSIDKIWKKELIANYNTIPTLDDYVKAIGRQEITLDNEGNVHIVFGKVPKNTFFPSQLCYVNNKTGKWLFEIVSNNSTENYDDGGWFPSLCLNNDGDPFITCVYIKRVPTGSAMETKLLFFKRSINGEWSSEIIASMDDGYFGTDGNNYTGGLSQLVFDRNNNPHIIFTDIASSHNGLQRWTLGNIRYAAKIDDVWNLSTIYRSLLPINYYNANEIYNLKLIYPENSNLIKIMGQKIITQDNTNYKVNLFSIDYENTITLSDTNSIMINPIKSFISDVNIYPNPSISKLNIEFNISRKTLVQIKIFNSNGILVKLIISEVLDTGYHKILVNTNDLASGIYNCCINASDFVNSYRIVQL